MDHPGLEELNAQVVECARCPRLSEYIRKVGNEKVKRFALDQYWARPLPSWGDPKARLMVVGLAPATHGGDSSGDWLARAMHEMGFASLPASRSLVDGLVLKDAYVTAAVRCAPPGNRPTRIEIANCSGYLLSEIALLTNVRVVLAVGKIAFDTYCKAAKLTGMKFGHGHRYNLGGKVLIASYHPSRQNTNTGRLTWAMWIGVFRAAKSLLDG